MFEVEIKKIKKLAPIDHVSYLKKEQDIPEKVMSILVDIGRETLEEVDPMTVLAAEAKAFAKEAREALFPDEDFSNEEIQNAFEDPENDVNENAELGSEESKDELAKEGDGSFEIQEEENVTASAELTKADMETDKKILERHKKPKVPKKPLKDLGVPAGDLNTRQIVEAILICSKSPLSAKKIAGGIEGCTENDIEFIVDELNEEYEQRNSSFLIYEIAGGFQIRTDPVFNPWLKEVFVKQRSETLTPASMETMAIVAYKQPITKVTVDSIRGVDCGSHMRNLMEKDLVQVMGKSEEIGNPNLYGTTKKFLEAFGLTTIEDLPSIEDIKDLV